MSKLGEEWKKSPESLRLDVDYAQWSADFTFKTLMIMLLLLALWLCYVQVKGELRFKDIEQRFNAIEHSMCDGQTK